MADVIVVGLGTMGSAAAEVLARRGATVVGLDRWAPPHEHGAHSGGTRIMRLAYAEGASYVPLIRRSWQLWGDLQGRAQRRLLTANDTLTIGRAGAPLLRGVIETVRTHGLDHEVLDREELAKRYPQFRPADDEIAMVDPAGATIYPEAAIDTCLSLAELGGARLEVDVQVTGWRAGAGGVTVTTSAGEVTGDRLVLCAGAGSPELLADLEVPWRVERRLQHYWRPRVESVYPAWMWNSSDGVTAYGLPWQEPPGGVKAAFHHPAQGEQAEVRAWLADRIPEMAEGDWLGATPCWYTLTPDEHFVLGRHPAHPNVSVAAGFSGHGFKFMPVVGEILADLALDGETRHNLALFAPSRFAHRF
jgi:sarcosine oxidase